MAEPDFKVIDGEIRTGEENRESLSKFLRDLIRKGNKKTAKGNYSKGSNFPRIYIDEQKQIFKHKGRTPDNFQFSSGQAVDLEKTNRQRSLSRSPGATTEAKLKRTELMKKLEFMNFLEPGQWELEHLNRAADFDNIEDPHGLGFAADDLDNLRINRHDLARTKTKGENIGKTYNSWKVGVDDDNLVFFNASNYDPQFPEKGMPFTKANIDAHEKFLKTGSLKGATDSDKKFINFALGERASTKLPLKQQRLVFYESLAQDNEVSKNLRNKAKSIVANSKTMINGNNGDNDNGKKPPKNGGTTESKVKIKNGKKNGVNGKDLAIQAAKNLPFALSIPATSTNAYMTIRNAIQDPSRKNIALAGLGSVEALADIAGLIPGAQIPAEAISQAAGKIGGGIHTADLLKSAYLKKQLMSKNQKLDPKALLQLKRLQRVAN
tara:strand:+ start:37 stop:1344 length:1308 start_codon:yes stop_codon:yes gene_type:complete